MGKVLLKQKKLSMAVIVIIFVAIFSISLGSVVCSAETGTVKGRVIDKSSKGVLPGISVSVDGTNILVYTDEKGEYSIDLAPGTYKLRAELLGYKPAEASNVMIIEGETNTVNLSMEEQMVIRGEETIVTGERLTVPLSKTTATVSVVSQKDVDKISVATNASDLLKNTPGVQVESGSSEFSKTIKIRGRTVAPPKVASAGILLLIDGVPSNDPGSGYANIYQIPSENIERIEVLKGASSAQYGGQAAAGVVNIITKKGQKVAFTKASVNYGTYQMRHGAERELIENYAFTHSWGNKVFDYSLSLQYSHTSGFTTADTNPIGNAYILFAKTHPGQGRLPSGIKVVPGGRREIPFLIGQNPNKLFDVGDHDKGERYNASLNLGINLFKNNKLRISPSYSYLNFYTALASPGFIPLKVADDTFLQYLLQVSNRRDTLNVADKWDITPELTYNFRVGLMKSTDIANFIFVNDFIDYSKEEEMTTGVKDAFANGTQSPFGAAPDFILNRSFNFANDISYKFDIADGNTFSFGQEYQWSKTSSPEMSYTTISATRKVDSFFFQDMQSIKDFTFSLGARWDQANRFPTTFSDELSPRFGVNYSIAPGTSMRFSVGRARRFPEFARTNGFAQSDGKLFGNPNLGPEINWTYEMGFMFMTKYVKGDIAYFYDDYSELEIPIPLSILGYDASSYSEKVLGISKAAQIASEKNFGQERAHIFVNGPKAVAQGFDASLEINPMENWDLNVSYTFQRHIVGNPNPFDFSQGSPQSVYLVDGKGVGPIFSGGNRIEYTPTHILKVGTSYTFPFGMNMDISGRFKSSTTFTTASYPGGQFPQDAHWIWDFKVAQPIWGDKVKINFAIDNVFSKLYYEDGGIPSNVAKYSVGVEAKF